MLAFYKRFFIMRIHPKIETHKIILNSKPLKTPTNNLFSIFTTPYFKRIGKKIGN